MATIKLTRLTFEQANAITISIESSDVEFIQCLNKMLVKYSVDELEEVKDIILDDSFCPDHEIELN